MYERANISVCVREGAGESCAPFFVPTQTTEGDEDGGQKGEGKKARRKN